MLLFPGGNSGVDAKLVNFKLQGEERGLTGTSTTKTLKKGGGQKPKETTTTKKRNKIKSKQKNNHSLASVFFISHNVSILSALFCSHLLYFKLISANIV